MRTWQVKPTGGPQWVIETPDGEMTECATGGVAIELGIRFAQESRGILLVYGRDGRVQATEDFQLH
jgi:hypothetical protein